MSVQWIAIGIFIALFALAILRKVHLGITMFAAACGVGLWLAKIPLKDVLEGFPVSIMVLLVGVTYFFAIAQTNGTIDRLIEVVLSRIGSKTVVLPFVFFGLTACISSMGSPLAGLVVTPIAMPIAKKYRIDSMLMALAIGCGFSAGAFAPTSLFGIVSYGTARQANIELSPFTLFAVAGITNLALLMAAFLIFGGRKLMERRDVSRSIASSVSSPSVTSDPDLPGTRSSEHHMISLETDNSILAQEKKDRFGPIQIATVLSMIGLIVTVIVTSVAGLNPDVGVLCLAFGAALALIDQNSGRAAVSKIDWSTVLLVGGIITYVGVLQKMGTVSFLGEAAKQVGSPILMAFVLCFIAGLVSAFASTTAILAALVPLALPLVASGEVAGWALISTLSVCASIVDVSPFSTVGATLVASAAEEDRPRMTSLLTRWGLSMVLIGPILLVTLLVLPSKR